MQCNSSTCGWWGKVYNSLFIVVIVHYNFKMQVRAASTSVTTTEQEILALNQEPLHEQLSNDIGFRYQVSFQTPSTLSTDDFISRSNQYSHLIRNSDINIGTRLRAVWPMVGIRHCVQPNSVVYQHYVADTSPLSLGIHQPEGDAGCSSIFVLQSNHNVGTCVLLFPKLPNTNDQYCTSVNISLMYQLTCKNALTQIWQHVRQSTYVTNWQ